MHAEITTNKPQAPRTGWSQPGEGLDFLWLELTNRCNLQCVHCYTESSPHSGEGDVLTGADYDRIMGDAFSLGCRKVQFIGGEPMLNADFSTLLRRAVEIGYTFVEVFTNLNRLDEETIRFSAANGVCFATSVYSDRAEEHDAVTKVRGSHARTIRNLKRLIEAGIRVRAGVIAVEQEPGAVKRTTAWLKALGVGSVRGSVMREFGRAEDLMDKEACLSGLCGHCWAGKLAVAPDGTAYCCVMARHWPVGDVLTEPLAAIVNGPALLDLRQTIYRDVWMPKISASGDKKDGDKDAEGGDPKKPVEACDPDEKPAGDAQVLCEPNDCAQSPCEPELCSQSCEPFCAQSCEPFHAE